jgi:quercetin dioxygenase-like cupin family protein
VLALASLAGPAGAADDWLVANQSDFQWTACGSEAPWNVCQRFALRGDREKEASDHMLRFPKGFVFPRHWHDNAENVIVTAGSMVISYDGGREEVVRAGGYLRIPAKVPHWGSCPDGCTFYLGLVGVDSYYDK